MLRLYTLLFYLILPFIILRLLWRSLRLPEYRQRLAERFGLFPPLPINGSLWVHAVSVGEVQAAEQLIKQLQQRHPDLPVVITTTTPTGSERVRTLFGDRVQHVYFPYDIPFAIQRFLRRASPRLLLMVETEIWPNLLAICEQQGITTILANARLSKKSARGYARFSSLTRETFRRIGLVAAQSEADAERFMQLGVSAERISVTGSVKFDMRMPASLRESAEALRSAFLGRPVWVAASTHEGEDAVVLAAHQRIREMLPQALLILVPRHPDRFERVAELCMKEGFKLARRSVDTLPHADAAVFLGDSMGELPLFLAAADAAFVGGSLVKKGGQNVLEPAALGKPVAFGSSMYNFSVISKLLLEQEAAVRVTSGSELAQTMGRWLGDAGERVRVGENGRRVVEQNRGALERLLALVEKQL